ncbi:MAG: rhodanese-like domain-containing protein [Cyanobacteria bacterium P01_G01_bin.54]
MSRLDSIPTLLVFAASLMLVACTPAAEQITPDELAAQIEAGNAPMILDVRSPQEYTAGHLPGAINIDFRELGDRLDELPKPEQRTVVVYCEQGVRAGIAEQTLKNAGFTQVLHLQGDIRAWRQQQLPLEKGEFPQSQLKSELTPETQRFSADWIVTASEAKQLLEQGATLLDAQGQGWHQQRLQEAIAVQWQQFAPPAAAQRGRLLADDSLLTTQLQALGISAQKPVIVFANPPQGWGEDGRIVWMLRTLGHPQAVIVDGGVQALLDVGVPRQHNAPLAAQPEPPRGDFVVQRNPTWVIERDALRGQLDSDHLVIIDSREPREFAGATPYGEQRGGHLPGAVNLYFKDLLGADGRLRSHPDLLAQLEARGIGPETPVVVYCTGGIRSAWLATVLVSLGFSVQNYAGSMWEWSAAPADDYPLRQGVDNVSPR